MNRIPCTFYQTVLIFMQFILVTSSCGYGSEKAVSSGHVYDTWAERLGFPAGKKVLILHADDMGMCDEANEATIYLLENNYIQSAAAMAPCPAYDDAIKWAIENPHKDIGIHLTLTSEWRTHRWATVADPVEVPGLLDPDGFMWRRVQDVAMNASPEEVEAELRAQIEKTLEMGYRPSHMDTHMGTLYAIYEFTEIYLRLAEEYRIPATVIDFSNPAIQDRYREQFEAMDEKVKELIANYSLPMIDNFFSTSGGNSYEEKREILLDRIRSLEAGLTEIIFHPQFKNDHGNTITGSWQHREWEAELFSDPVVIQFFRDEGILFTNWMEIMERFDGPGK
jgi:chitin disaccharide deacetylase